MIVTALAIVAGWTEVLIPLGEVRGPLEAWALCACADAARSQYVTAPMLLQRQKKGFVGAFGLAEPSGTFPEPPEPPEPLRTLISEFGKR